MITTGHCASLPTTAVMSVKELGASSPSNSRWRSLSVTLILATCFVSSAVGGTGGNLCAFVTPNIYVHVSRHCFVGNRDSMCIARMRGRSTGEGDDGDPSNKGGEDDEVESERRRLVSLFGFGPAADGGGDAAGGAQKRLSEYPRPVQRKIVVSLTRALHEKIMNSDYVPPPLSSTGRERRIREISLLKGLGREDSPVPELWALWFAERGPAAAEELLGIDQLISKGPIHWDEAEGRLWDAVQEHGVEWAEPVNRLATLFYLQKRLEESRALCEVVLTVKPWHFGALSGLVMVHASLGDTINARIWADRVLPPLQPTGDNERRRIWVERAVSDALATLARTTDPDMDTAGGDNGESEGSHDQEDSSGDFDDAWQ